MFFSLLFQGAKNISLNNLHTAIYFVDLYGGSQTLPLPKRSFRWGSEQELGVLQSYFNIRYENRHELDERINLNSEDFFPNWEWYEETGSWINPLTGGKTLLGEGERWEMFLEVDMEYCEEVSKMMAGGQVNKIKIKQNM